MDTYGHELRLGLRYVIFLSNSNSLRLSQWRENGGSWARREESEFEKSTLATRASVLQNQKGGASAPPLCNIRSWRREDYTTYGSNR
jgi:hypothetical protein